MYFHLCSPSKAPSYCSATNRVKYWQISFLLNAAHGQWNQINGAFDKCAVWRKICSSNIFTIQSYREHFCLDLNVRLETTRILKGPMHFTWLIRMLIGRSRSTQKYSVTSEDTDSSLSLLFISSFLTAPVPLSIIYPHSTESRFSDTKFLIRSLLQISKKWTSQS